MLKLVSDRIITSSEPEQEIRSPALDLAALRKIIREQWPVIGAVAAAVVFLALLYVLTARPYYTATTGILIDTHKNQLLQNQQIVGDQLIDSGMIDSQVEVIKSESVALAVIRDLKLTEEPEFVRPDSSMLGVIVSLLSGGDDAQSQNQLERKAVLAYLNNLKVKRIGTTYVLEASYAAQSPEMASRVANSIADAYMVGELEAKYQATKRASRWLQDRIAELRQQAQAADQAVQSFKSDNEIVGTNRGLMSDQQLGDVNAQLVTARAATAEAKARLDRIVEINRGDLPDATVTDALRNDVINRLRAQYLDLAAKEADWSNRYGATHVAAQNLRNQMREIKRSIVDEVRRIAETYKSEYEISRTREQSLQDSLAVLVGQSATTGQAQVRLRDLESSAQTARNLYDTFLQRSMETTQQQTFPVTDARVITTASEPTRKSHPKTLLILAGASGVGLMLGFGIAVMRVRLDRVFRTVADIAQVTGHEALGIVPLLSSTRNPDAIPAVARVAAPSGRQIALDLGQARHVVDAPFSRMAETLRSVRVAIDSRGLTQEMKIIGITSSVPREGKTLVSSNLAQLVAQTGRRTILIDGDFRNPSTTRALAPENRGGLLEVLRGQSSEADLVWVDPVTGLEVLPIHAGQTTPHSAELLSSKAMIDLLGRVREKYDYVFVDLPPIMPVVDVRAVSHLIDGFVFVVEWGGTTHEAVRESLISAELVRQRLLGFVLNKAAPSALKRVESYKGRYYRNYYLERAG